MSGIERYRSKPKPKSDMPTIATLYLAGESLVSLQTVAAMADRHAQMAEAVMPDGQKVLLIQWRRSGECGSDVEWEIVQDGEYLVYSEEYGSLVADSRSSLDHWYQRVDVP